MFDSTAQEQLEITVPTGWVATESGIAKGNNELFIGPVLKIGDQSEADYLSGLAQVPIENLEIIEIAELKDGDLVTQVTRDVTNNGSKARSTLLICKSGRNKHRLLELYTEDVFAIIAGGKAAIDFCSQP